MKYGSLINLFTLYKIINRAQYRPTGYPIPSLVQFPFPHVTAGGRPAKTEKVKVLHYLDACFQPLTPTNEPVANVNDGSVQLYVLSSISDNFQDVAEIVLNHLANSIWFCCCSGSIWFCCC